MTRAAVGQIVKLAIVLLATHGPAHATNENPRNVAMAFVAQSRTVPRPMSPIRQPRPATSVEGARLGLADANAAGRFAGLSFSMTEASVNSADEASRAMQDLARQDIRIILSDLEPELLTSVAEQNPRSLIVDVRSRNAPAFRQDCFPNVLHTMPDRAMLADALAQYSAANRWRNWMLVTGPGPGNGLLADAYRRAASRFGITIVAERQWTFVRGLGRADTGHVTVGEEIPALTRGPDHDLLVVADEEDAFGELLVGRTARARPVAGTHGLVVTAFDPVQDQWGAAQLQARFEKRAARRMGADDYAAWAAVAAISEAALRNTSAYPDSILQTLKSPDFIVSGFKGRGQSFRSWDGRMRQPILIAGPQLLVSVSPQQGFLHQKTELDTLGIGPEESPCAR